MHQYKNDSNRSRSKVPKRELGQNFLVDKRFLSKIISASEISSQDTILEIGAGKGILTRELARSARQVLAVEIDPWLVADLNFKFASTDNINIVEGDARHIDYDELLSSINRYKLVANLPYYAASPILRKFLEADKKPSLIVVMVQKEVAENMTAKPGNMSLLSVATQLYGNPRIIASVPPRAFRPSPKVTSAILRLDVYAKPLLELESIKPFFFLVKAGFSSKRKQIHNCLKQSLDISSESVMAILDSAEIDAQRRPQTLSLCEWGSLYRAFSIHYPHVSKS